MIENSPATIYSCSKHIRTGREADRYDSGLKAHNLARLFPAIDESHAHRSSTAPQSENAHSIGVQREHVRYDANGNLTNRAGTTLSWFASNLPKAITKNSQNSSVFQYTPTGARWRHAYKSANVTYTQIYLGSLMEKVTQGSAVDWKHYIFAEGQAVVLYSRKSSGVNTLSYLLRDALGSVDAITDSAGAVTVRESFGAFGQRRGTAWSGAPSSGELATINGLTRRGYTGHEMLDSTDLIHMNGRVYDPFIARFVSADPYLDANLRTQGWSRFGYVGNNPLTAVDPSGFTSFSSERPHVRPIMPECAKHPSSCASWSGTVEGYHYSWDLIKDGETTHLGDIYYYTFVSTGPVINWGGAGGPSQSGMGGPGEGSRGANDGRDGAREDSEPPEAPQSQQQCVRMPGDGEFGFNDFVDFSAGLGDALLLGFGDNLRDMLGIESVDMDTGAYSAGGWSSFALGMGRAGYAMAAKGYSMFASSGAAASAGRESFKKIGRFGQGSEWRKFDPTGKTDAQLRAGAGKTNKWINAYGAGVAAAGGFGANRCQ